MVRVCFVLYMSSLRPHELCSPPGSSVHGVLQARILRWVQFSSVIQLCPALCNPMNCSTPGLPVPHPLSEFAQVHVHCIGDDVQPSYPPTPSSLPSIFSSIRDFSVSQLFASDDQKTGTSASASVLPVSVQLISLKID